MELNKKFLPFYELKARYKIAYGGRNGGKSHSVATILLIKGVEKPLRIVCIREFLKNLDESVYALLSDKICSDDALRKHYKIYADKIKGKNGTEVTFTGIKNAEGFKGYESVDIAWIEEASQMSLSSWLLVEPTVRKPGSEFWFTYNPSTENDPVHQLMLKPLILDDQQKKDMGVDIGQINLQINYTDNPHCPTVMKITAERMKQNDHDLYRHTWLGECKQYSDALIYKNKFKIEYFDYELYFGRTLFSSEMIELQYGYDIGFVHPTVILETFRHNGYIYVRREIAGTQLDLDDVTERLISEMPQCLNRPIWADSARPDVISTLRQDRLSKTGVSLPALDVRPVNKSQGSVEAGIEWLKTHVKIIIHPDCKQTIHDFEKYSYAKDKNDIIKGVVSKVNDDACDALRYAYKHMMSEDQPVNWSNVHL